MTRRKPPAPTPAPDLADLLQSWQIDMQAEHLSAQTIRGYSISVRLFIDWCQHRGVQPEMTRNLVAAWIAGLLESGAEPSTARARQLGLRRFSAWLTEQDEYDVDPLLGIRAPKLDVKVTPALTDIELRRLIDACSGKAFIDKRDEAVLRLMIETGLRAGEVVAMQLDDVDIVRGMATIRRGKGGRGRVVPFSAQTRRCLDRYLRARRGHRLADSAVFWLGDRGKGFSYDGLHSALAARARQAGLEGFHPHLLRHTAASRWLAAGGSEGGLMSVAGWTRRDMLDRYTRATAAERAADEARRLNLGDI